jgi:hypothetical protein
MNYKIKNRNTSKFLNSLDTNTLSWIDLHPKDCKDLSKIKEKDLFKNTKVIEKGEWIESNDISCASCYASYTKVCVSVATEFNLYKNIKKHWLGDELKLMINNIVNKSKDIKSILWLDTYEKKLQSIIDCINSRVYHHLNCHKYIGSNIINKDISNEKHMDFLKVLCESMFKLYILYEYKLKDYNDKNNKFKKNILTDLNKECMNNCLIALDDINNTNNFFNKSEIKNISKLIKLNKNNKYDLQYKKKLSIHKRNKINSEQKQHIEEEVFTIIKKINRTYN